MRYFIALIAIGTAWLAGSSWILFTLVMGTFAVALWRWDQVATQKANRQRQRRIEPTEARR